MNRSNSASDNGSKGADFLQLRIADAPPGGRADWLAQRLRTAIADGVLLPGTTLPASRVLADDLQVSRGVVTEAYQRLTEDGHVEGRGRNGTVVVAVPVPEPGLARPRTLAAEGIYTGTPGVRVFDDVRSLEARVDFSPGVPDLAAFPRAAWLRAERVVLNGVQPSSFGYGDPRGVEPLRLAVAQWLARTRGIRAEPHEVIIVAGVSQALQLLGRVLPGDGISEVAVEDPGSLGVRQHLQHWGFGTPPVDVDESGLRVDQLVHCGAPAVLVTPAHQFPTGVVLESERRRALLAWARAGGLVVEDDYDAEHRYDRPPVPALRSVLSEQVVYTGSASKLLAPALRLGWVVAPRRLQDHLVDAKRFADLGNAVLPQLVLAELMSSGALERQLRLLRRRHRARRDAMVEALRVHVPSATVHGAAAGLHLMVTFAADVRDRDLAAGCLAEGVKVQPLSWHRQRPGPPGLVLGYAASSPAAIADGVAALGRVVNFAAGRAPVADATRLER
jgi:GntR family transcriptional regulator / MocR family aminotransferase